MPQVWFRVWNTWTEILGADQAVIAWNAKGKPLTILDLLDKESSYPTASAEVLKWGGGDADPSESKWDGWIHLMHRPKIKTTYFPTGLVPRLSRICWKFGIEPCIEDMRERPMEGFPEHSQEGDIIDRDYQLAAADAAVKIGRGVLDLPPRSGKSRTMIEIHRRLALPTIWVAPTSRIVDQTTDTINFWLGKNYAKQLTGSGDQDSAFNTRIVTCTAQTAANLSQEFYQTREMLVVDEFHHGSAKIYTRGIFPKCDHIYFRLGMTGTHFRSGDDELAMHGLMSNVIFKVSSQFLLERGHLVPTKVVFIPMPSHPKVRGVGNTFQSGHGKHGIHIHKGRNQLAAHAAYYLSRAGRKTLILVGTKAQGYEIKRMLTPFFGESGSGYEFNPVEFLSTDVRRPKQKRVLESYLANEEVKVLIGTSLLGEGVDLPNVDALVYARGEKAEVSLRQNWFRVCTAIPGKKNAIIVDFADRHNGKLMKHSHQRLNAYFTEPIFQTQILSDANQFVPWVNSI